MRSRRSPRVRASAHCAGNARLLAAPNRYLVAGSTAGSCLLESADDGAAFAKDYPDQVPDAPDGPTNRVSQTPERRETWETLEIASLVIVHGGWGGGWEWTEVARSLRECGHDVFTPTLTGMGERAHLGHPQVGLSTHVEDVVAVLELEDLHKVVLCGHSYGGMPVTGAADRVIDRIGLVIYIDALVPRHGQSAFDLLPGLFRQLAQASADAQGDGWRVPIPASLLPPAGWITDEERTRYVARLRDQPLATFTEPLHITGAIDSVGRAFVRCTGDELGHDLGGDPIAPAAARARREGWVYRELVAPHDPQLTDPVGTATALHELAATARIEPDLR